MGVFLKVCGHCGTDWLLCECLFGHTDVIVLEDKELDEVIDDGGFYDDEDDDHQQLAFIDSYNSNPN